MEVLQTSPQPDIAETPPNSDAGATNAARKLTFSTTSSGVKPTMAEVVKGNREQHTGLKLDYFPPVMNDGVKVVKLNPQEIADPNQKWSLELIGYVIGGNPTFNEILKFVYGVWNFVNTPQLTAQEQWIACARILIEMDISQPLHDSLSLELPNGKYYSQSIEYEWRPMYCQDCLKVGHITWKCKEGPAEPKQPQQNNKKKLEWKAKDVPNQTGDGQTNSQATEKDTSKEHPKNEQEAKGVGQQQRKQIDRGKKSNANNY
ncbi:hypothetical protein A4A49_15595 [Nicotiana attenuata]|uniref:DUF4283 domain-containing protein n=1 Tax=Nicotiana attenuata TaxID=49451 RepID=A0A1J6IJ12_NICAT|nr:hypothetical protein A4A49_15595 [Nicotiana attenuata]